ncbi:MAG: F0F1 ATP synthase subunit B [Candidatus Cardinium sp.]|uniref:F0F1 ATP synthase subunit B n=1 Tax=Cardinium endosymbiont of Dermatophagoides farinae TaxID=2597823 RepID=UPI0011828DD0|nr:F0F1 ATP synthase subunit B [Cardinium endosymbiont of Dermatophagoides farinae]TSJ80842.1 F0F1 ATP synthase subunit B [Cardinium endosymbiont of Dermatophagoides farinae]UWW96847.1 MAG: F0F1 ATP synthase subunit B [Candidatus Cardinium sp.]
MNLITPDFGIIFWQTTTFLVVLFVLSKFAWKPILEVVQAREHAVANAVDKIAQAQALIKQVEDDKVRLIGEAHLERERIIGEALTTQQAIINQAHQEGLAVKEQLLAQARIEITREEARTLEAARANIGALVLQVAEKLLVKELSADSSQWELIERCMANEHPSA